jgi:type VI secretion system protein ImpH
MPLDQASLLSRAGLLAMAPAPASAIESVLTSLFGVPARVVQFLPSWYAIDASDRARLGGANTRLGVDLHLGEQVLLVQSRFRVSLGPVKRDRFIGLLPDGSEFAALSSVVRLAAGVEFDFDVQIVLVAAEVPETQLCGGAGASQLGWTTWLRRDDMTEDAHAAIFEPAMAGRDETWDSISVR